MPEVAGLTAVNSGVVNLGPGFCLIMGTHALFDDATLNALYRNHGVYVSLFNQTVNDSLRKGYLLEPDADAMREATAVSPVPPEKVIRTSRKTRMPSPGRMDLALLCVLALFFLGKRTRRKVAKKAIHPGLSTGSTSLPWYPTKNLPQLSRSRPMKQLRPAAGIRLRFPGFAREEQLQT